MSRVSPFLLMVGCLVNCIPLWTQVSEPAVVFQPAIEEIRAQTRIPILLPSKLPSYIRLPIKLATGRASKDAYFVSLYYEEVGSNATYAAGFGGTAQLSNVAPNVKLGNGIGATFVAVSCGGSCAPANLWWVSGGVEYCIQVKLPSKTKEKDQKRILIETANLMVQVPKR